MMRALMLMAAGGLAMAIVGCEKPQFKVVADLPLPVAGAESLRPVIPAEPPRLTQVGPQTGNGATAGPNGNGSTQGNSGAAKTKTGLFNPPLKEWTEHSRDNGWRYIIIHHSATARGNAASFGEQHRQKGWDELGYHFVIGNGADTPDGKVEVGPRWKSQKHGAHCKTNDNRFNDYGIGICLVGDFETGGRPTARQMASLQALVSYLAERYRIPVNSILGHGEAVGLVRENRATKCPGRYVDMAALRQTIRHNVRLAGIP